MKWLMREKTRGVKGKQEREGEQENTATNGKTTAQQSQQ